MRPALWHSTRSVPSKATSGEPPGRYEISQQPQRMLRSWQRRHRDDGAWRSRRILRRIVSALVELWGQERWKWRLRAVSSAGHVNLPGITHEVYGSTVRRPSQLSSWPLTPAQGAGSTFELQPRAQPIVDRSCIRSSATSWVFEGKAACGTETLKRGRSNTFLGTVAKRAACSSFAGSIARRRMKYQTRVAAEPVFGKPTPLSPTTTTSVRAPALRTTTLRSMAGSARRERRQAARHRQLDGRAEADPRVGWVALKPPGTSVGI